MTSASPYPDEGAKLLLERASVAEDCQSAAYVATIFVPDRRYDFDAALAMDGTASLEPREDHPDPALEKALTNIAKSIARAARRKRDEGLPPWPHRINRWRGPGRG